MHFPARPTAGEKQRPRVGAEECHQSMDALRKSDANDTGKPAKAPATRKGQKRAERQREMLLPIVGKKKEVAKETQPVAPRKAS